MRRADVWARRRDGFRGYGGGSDVYALGVQFTSGKYAIGTAGQFANAYRRLRVCWSPDAQPGTALSFVAGLDGGGGGSILLGAQERGGGYANGAVLGFDAVYSTTAPAHVLLAGELGRYVVDDLVIDGTSLLHYRNGRLVQVGIADADTSWTSANPFALNCRPSAAGTLQFGSCTVFDVQLATTVPTAAAVLTDAQKLPGVLASGTVLNHWWMAEAAGTTVTDRVSSRVLTFTGSPTLGVRKPVYRQSAGSVCYIGDSNVIRNEGGVTGNGPRKDFLVDLVDAGVACTAAGKFAGGANITKDFDPRNTGLSGQAVGVANGAVAAILTTIAADLAAYVAPSGSVVLMYKTNDGYVYCNTPGGNTGAAAAALFFAEYDDLIVAVGDHMDAGRPIVVDSGLRVSTGVSNAAQRDFDVAVQAGWAAKIAEWQVAYPGVELADTYSALTPTQADADNVAVLPDGTHLADSLQPTRAGIQSAALLRALARAPS